MEKALDNVQHELIDIRTDRDMKIREAAAVESRFADLQVRWLKSQAVVTCEMAALYEYPVTSVVLVASLSTI